MTDRLITADARTVHPHDFARACGLRIRTREQKAADWDAEVERYVKLLVDGAELSEYGNPAVREAKERLALRDASVHPDPFGGGWLAEAAE